MDTKERLSRYPALHSEVIALCSRLEQLERAEIIADRAELDDIEAQVTANLDEMERLRALIRTLPDPMEREVLTRRYVEGSHAKPTKWKSVAQTLLGGSAEKHLQMVFRLHRSALKHLDQTAGA